MPWRTFYVIVASREEAKEFAMVPKGLPVSFQY